MKERLNGWQRLWVVVCAVYLAALVIGMIVLPGEDSAIDRARIFLVLAVVPSVVLYIGGVSVAWIIRGFREAGARTPTPWQRLWVVASVVTLMITGLFLVGRIQEAILADQILSGGLGPEQSVEYFVVADDHGRREVFAQSWSDKGGLHWVRLGRVRTSDSQSVLERAGEWNPESRRWKVSRETVLGLIQGHRPRDIIFSIAGSLMIWVLPPIGVYLGAYLLILGVIWVRAGFKVKASA